uniref:transmembrane 9 superfamily member 5-like n=1 Tax=Erigeron canadensis TaxID=72917 RepID=UPI001CB97552|nr:transmembrane 9 superfamily member 5-like [Erigeron canadensis]
MTQKNTTFIHMFLVVLTTLEILVSPIIASSFDHRYNVGDDVPLFVNIIGPLNNPSETYQYYDLPFCHPDQVIPKKETLGEVFNGDRMTNTLYNLKFRKNKVDQVLCDKKLTRDDITKLKNAIDNDYYFQMYYDELPLWGFIGKVEDESFTGDGLGPTYILFKHVQFDALYNSDQIIEIRAFSDPNYVVDISDKTEVDITFTYSIYWNATSSEYKNRMNKYSRASLLPTQRHMHWFSFINSVVIIVLLTGLLIMLFMRHLKNDLKRYSSVDEEQDKEVGWKYVHGDVFRCPPRMALFCAVLGTGTQLLTIICLLFVLAFFGIIYPYSRGTISTSIVLFFILTAPVAGYSAASFFGQFSETGWEKCVLLSGIIYIGPLSAIMLLLNTVSISFGSTTAFPFGTIVVILLAYTLIAIPLLAFGGIMGFRFRSKFQAPTATKISPREIPWLNWYGRTPGQMLISGLLPFSAIVLELHNVYATIWSYKIFTTPSILFLTFVLLVILTSLLSVGLTYIQLTVEDHQWWWRSVWRGGSVAIFMFLYCIYYFSRSNMNGFMQSAFFFCYNFLFCYAFFLMLATISFRSSWIFMQHIYNAVKSE